ncbi:MAG: T9SS type A sorting domain-containing protein [Candidatus Cloacimonetes bacterium]|nr:T9SS type A sorting domain-containing protein [Candidatus Cloacimonadota bacterium]
MRLTEKILLLACLTVFSSQVYAMLPLSNIYSNGMHSDNHTDVLVWSNPGESILYDAPGGLAQQPMEVLWDDLSWQTSSVVLSPNAYIGFRNESNGLSINPVYWNSTTEPNLQFYTPLETDPIGDHLFGSAWLDITQTKVTFSNERIYFAIQNNHTSFPVSSGLTFFAYMPVLVNPAASPEDDPLVFGLMYTVELSGVISPGLYKISGTGVNDLEQIGEIQHSILDNTLILSCALSDLYADSDFMAWFNPDYPQIATTTTTSKITLTGGSQQADITVGADLLLIPQLVNIANVNAPLLSDAAYSVEQGMPDYLSASIQYSDADNNFPMIASLSIDGGEEHPLIPYLQTYPDFTLGVLYSVYDVPIAENWQQLTYRFSDGEGFVYRTIDNGSAIQDNVQAPMPKLQLYPNPVQNMLNLKNNTDDEAIVEIYNVRGQAVASYTLPKGKEAVQLYLKEFATGIYWVRIQGRKSRPVRFVKL